MQSLGLALASKGDRGEPLPVIFKSFASKKILFKRSQLSVIAAAPGGGKTALTIWQLMRMVDEQDVGIPTLYMCADTDMMTVAATALAGIMEIRMEEAEVLIGQEDPETMALLEEWSSHIWFCFLRGPTLEDIQIELQAYAHVHGEHPHMVIIDTLRSVAERGEDLHRYSVIMPALADVANNINAHVLALHHVTGAYENGDKQIPRTGIEYKITKEASMVLTLWRPDQETMFVSVVKSRSGPHFTDGSYGVELSWDPSRGWFGDA